MTIFEQEGEEVEWEQLQDAIDSHQVVKKYLIAAFDKPNGQDEFFKGVMRDLTRTFSNYRLFKHSAVLAKVLDLFLVIHQEIEGLKYIQGLNFIVASLALH